eukprot:g6505.t1
MWTDDTYLLGGSTNEHSERARPATPREGRHQTTTAPPAEKGTSNYNNSGSAPRLTSEMSFFTSGLSGFLNNKGKKKATPQKDGGKKKSSDKKDEGKWELLTDAFGRTYWQHSATGEWRWAAVGGALVSPDGTVNPSPVVAYPAMVSFTPPPVAVPPPAPVAVPPPAPVAVPPPPPPAKKKDDDKKKGKGWWKSCYDEYGDRYYEHTVTKEVTRKDPYV